MNDFAYEPEEPQGGQITVEVCLYEAERLLTTPGEVIASDRKLGDDGTELLPRLVAACKVWSFPLGGYWRDVGAVESYWRAHRELLDSENTLALDDADWPILAYGTQRLSARLLGGAEVRESLVSPGGNIDGAVSRSVLAPGVVIEKDALVEESIVFQGARILAGARVQRAIVDEKAEVGAGAVVGGAGEVKAGEEIAVVGHGAWVGPGKRVPPGEQLLPE